MGDLAKIDQSRRDFIEAVNTLLAPLRDPNLLKIVTNKGAVQNIFGLVQSIVNINNYKLTHKTTTKQLLKQVFELPKLSILNILAGNSVFIGKLVLKKTKIEGADIRSFFDSKNFTDLIAGFANFIIQLDAEDSLAFLSTPEEAQTLADQVDNQIPAFLDSKLKEYLKGNYTEITDKIEAFRTALKQEMGNNSMEAFLKSTGRYNARTFVQQQLLIAVGEMISTFLKKLKIKDIDSLTSTKSMVSEKLQTAKVTDPRILCMITIAFKEIATSIEMKAMAKPVITIAAVNAKAQESKKKNENKDEDDDFSLLNNDDIESNNSDNSNAKLTPENNTSYPAGSPAAAQQDLVENTIDSPQDEAETTVQITVLKEKENLKSAYITAMWENVNNVVQLQVLKTSYASTLSDEKAALAPWNEYFTKIEARKQVLIAKNKGIAQEEASLATDFNEKTAAVESKKLAIQKMDIDHLAYISPMQERLDTLQKTLVPADRSRLDQEEASLDTAKKNSFWKKVRGGFVACTGIGTMLFMGVLIYTALRTKPENINSFSHTLERLGTFKSSSTILESQIRVDEETVKYNEALRLAQETQAKNEGPITETKKAIADKNAAHKEETLSANQELQTLQSELRTISQQNQKKFIQTQQETLRNISELQQLEVKVEKAQAQVKPVQTIIAAIEARDKAFTGFDANAIAAVINNDDDNDSNKSDSSNNSNDSSNSNKSNDMSHTNAMDTPLFKRKQQSKSPESNHLFSALDRFKPKTSNVGSIFKKKK